MWLLAQRFHFCVHVQMCNIPCLVFFCIGPLFFWIDFVADIAQRYRISKYPTLKLFRNGMMMKREYRGQRSVTAIADYIRQQKSNPIREVQDLEEINTVDVSSVSFLLSISMWKIMYSKNSFTSWGFFHSKMLSDNFELELTTLTPVLQIIPI